MLIIKYVKVAIIGVVCFWLGIYIGSISFKWNGFTDGWVSAIGSWVSGIIAGGTLFYAINKDRGELRKKIKIIDANIRELNLKYLDFYDYSLKLGSYVDELKSTLTDNSIKTEKDYLYKVDVNNIKLDPLMNILNLSRKIERETRLKILGIPDTNAESINNAIEGIVECCIAIDKFELSSHIGKKQMEQLIFDTGNLLSKMDKYTEKISYLVKVMETSKKMVQL